MSHIFGHIIYQTNASWTGPSGAQREAIRYFNRCSSIRIKSDIISPDQPDRGIWTIGTGTREGIAESVTRVRKSMVYMEEL